MKRLSSFSVLAGLAVIALGGVAYAAEALPNISGTFRCQTDVSKCDLSGNTFTVMQTGAHLDVKNDKGAIGVGTVTSNITISMGPPWNMYGVMSNNSREIEWSNGTKWMKQ